MKRVTTTSASIEYDDQEQRSNIAVLAGLLFQMLLRTL
jgi:hypothetical protein